MESQAQPLYVETEASRDWQVWLGSRRLIARDDHCGLPVLR